MLVGEHAFGELLEACLAINLGYLALDRFRYRDAIRRIIATATSHLEGMPEKYRKDKAWEDLSIILQTQGPDAEAKFLSWIYNKIFNRGVDRGISLAAAIVSFVALALRATTPTVDSLWSHLPVDCGLVLFSFLVTTAAMSAFLIKFGQGCVHRVASIITKNVQHLAKLYKEENQNAAEKMIEFVNELGRDH